MNSQPDPPTVIEGRVVHKKSNALQITFHDGPGDPIAVGVQGAGDGKGKKFGTLLGFKNGGTGNHRLTYGEGAVVGIASREGAPTILTRGDGTEFATIERGPTSSAVLTDGGELFTFVADAEEAMTLELFRVCVFGPSGEQVGRLDVIRRAAGWTLSQAAQAAWQEYFWFENAGRPLPVPILGTRLSLLRPITGIERDVLLGACVDLAIGLRPYIADMN
ncbi:MAG TPA: hypothetical protein VNV87_12150 [Acidimicrobiales bacterium]|jgi:hypothetical protein|nr:hypothetical protein [Acidimicrobiales bacterium]